MEEHGTKVIVVLGMHRSGTSVIARGLQVMGIDLGNRLMPPFEGNNSKGFWEDVDINALNIEMLHSLKRDWHFVTPIQPADVDTLCTNGFLQRAVELLQKKTAGVNVFGFKDPRVAKLLPFWKKVFTHARIHVDYLLVIRHPLSVCESLVKRDGLDFEKSHLLWLEHVIGSLAGTEGETRVLADYDGFMRSPEAELTRIARELRLPIHAAEMQSFLLEFLDRKLQHTVYQLEDLLHDNTASPLVKEVYSALLDPAMDNARLQDKIVQWDKEFSRMRPILGFVDKLGLKIGAITAERNALNERRNALVQEKTQLAQTLAEKEQALQKRGTELETIYQSRLWRWTKPLRLLFHRVQRPK
jgi:hypothetical protein